MILSRTKYPIIIPGVILRVIQHTRYNAPATPTYTHNTAAAADQRHTAAKKNKVSRTQAPYERPAATKDLQLLRRDNNVEGNVRWHHHATYQCQVMVTPGTCLRFLLRCHVTPVSNNSTYTLTV